MTVQSEKGVSPISFTPLGMNSVSLSSLISSGVITIASI